MPIYATTVSLVSSTQSQWLLHSNAALAYGDEGVSVMLYLYQIKIDLDKFLAKSFLEVAENLLILILDYNSNLAIP